MLPSDSEKNGFLIVKIMKITSLSKLICVPSFKLIDIFTSY